MPPLERHALLRPLSREHHEALLLCWRIRQGLKNAVSIDGLMASVRAFYHDHLLAHFAVEEEVVFTVLSADDPLVKRALAEHRRLTRLILKETDALKALNCFEEELEAHVRFEERVLFPQVQAVASMEQLERIDQLHGVLSGI